WGRWSCGNAPFAPRLIKRSVDLGGLVAVASLVRVVDVEKGLAALLDRLPGVALLDPQDLPPLLRGAHRRKSSVAAERLLDGADAPAELPANRVDVGGERGHVVGHPIPLVAGKDARLALDPE